MCGITGIFDFQRKRRVDADVLRSMLDTIRHRGPDDDGVHVDNELAIGMRRLSIIDLEGGHQPIFNETKEIAVVCNGEIYNYVELRQQLESRGHRFATDSDVEVIVHLYEEVGDECVEQLRGMFAFAIWDARHRRLLISRDRLGIKPLYFHQENGRLIFASEIKSILCHPDVSPEPDLTGISQYLSLKYVAAPRTMFDGIESLMPGHQLVCDDRGMQLKSYWDLSFNINRDNQHTEADYVDELDELLHDAVRLRLRSDVPFGAFLSGGVDSSTIVALMSRIMNEPVKTFSVGFHHRKGKRDELPYARQVSKQYQTDHHEIVMTPDYFTDMAERVIWHLDQPIADQATLAMFAVSDLASQHVKMVLTGEGGDELFAGYARYYGDKFSRMFNLVPGPLKHLALASCAHIPKRRRQKIALFALCQKDEVARFTNWFPLFNSATIEKLVENGNHAINGMAAQQAFGSELARTDATEPLNRMLYVDTKLWLPDFLLMRGDKMSMANSLEARVPMLDHKLVEFAAALPTKMKLKGTTQKYLLKQVARRYLPSEIIDRKKEGFPIPISSWFRHEMKPFVRDMLSPETILRRGLFNPNYVTRLVEEHESRFADHGALIWGLISLELWYRIYIDSPLQTTFHTNQIVVASQ